MDDFIGKRFGKNGHLEVLYISGKKRSNKVYAVICHICKNDPELFGDGIFHRVKGDLLAGNIPCGCSNNVRWSRRQYEVLVTRKCKELGYSFSFLTGEGKGKQEKFEFICDKGHVYSMSINNFLFGFRCKKCFFDNVAEYSKISDEECIAEFYKNDIVKEGTIFCRENSGRNKTDFWSYKCGNCSHDDYVKNGVCSGIFRTASASLKQGMLSCRCNKNPKRTKAQREYEIKKRIRDEGLSLTFKCWNSEKFGIKDKFTLICEKHGEFEKSVTDFLHKKTNCASCAVTGYDKNKDASFYILKIEGDLLFTGFGISNYVESRLKHHSSILKNLNLKITEFMVLSSDGKSVLDLESDVKKKFTIEKQDICGFKTEAINYSEYDNLINYAIRYLYSR